MLSDLFKKKDKRSSRVSAIVKYYDEMQLPPPPELVEVAEKEGLVPPPYIQSRPAVPQSQQAPPAPEPLKVAETEVRVPPSYTQPRPVVPDAQQAPLAPVKVEEKEGWVSPAYTQSRQVVLNPKQLLANRCVGYLCGSYESESYKMLRTRLLQKTGEQGGTTIMITSAVPGEGKTLTAINLSLTFAKEYNQTVLLVDSDLHKQSVHEYLGFESDRGLADYLLNGTALADLIVWPGVEKFTVISGGRTVMTSSELLGSPRMKELVKDLKGRYPDRYVFFDVAPVLAGADALAFAPQVDYIILVVRAGSTSIEDVKLALDLLPRKTVLGVVLNRADQVDMISKYHTYKYGKEGPGTRNNWDQMKDVIEKVDKPGIVKRLLNK